MHLKFDLSLCPYPTLSVHSSTSRVLCRPFNSCSKLESQEIVEMIVHNNSQKEMTLKFFLETLLAYISSASHSLGTYL